MSFQILIITPSIEEERIGVRGSDSNSWLQCEESDEDDSSDTSLDECEEEMNDHAE